MKSSPAKHVFILPCLKKEAGRQKEAEALHQSPSLQPLGRQSGLVSGKVLLTFMKYSSGIHFLVFFGIGGGGGAFALSLIIAFKSALCRLLSLNKKGGKKWEGEPRNKGYNHLGEEEAN